jgi:hypothetical protein
MKRPPHSAAVRASARYVDGEASTATTRDMPPSQFVKTELQNPIFAPSSMSGFANAMGALE